MGRVRNQALIKKIAKRVKELREERGLSQEAVYFESNIHVGRVESAQVNITVSSLEALCKYFGITLAEFFKKIE